MTILALFINYEGEFRKLYDKVEKIINEWDPIDLLPIFPYDEYRDEIIEIVELVKKSSDINEVTNGIEETFSNNFGGDVFKKTYEDCLIIAKILISVKVN